jgi:hypothetical protein
MNYTKIASLEDVKKYGYQQKKLVALQQVHR